MKKHNFSAGPSILPRVAIEKTAQAILDFNGLGLSILEISHRSKDFEQVLHQARQLFVELLGIPSGYHVLFLGGGARLQFAMIPFNLMKSKAVYVNTGVWATGALKEAKMFGEILEIRSNVPNFTTLPTDYEIDPTADYVHITTNNTIYGTQLKKDIDSPIPVIADASSDILSRPIDVSKYGIIYGGAQKNCGPAGVTFVIVREDLLGKVDHKIPTMLDYRVHIEHGSMYNTPPVLPIYTMMETLIWLKQLGGIQKIQQLNEEKASILYKEIDENPLFVGTANVIDRSLMNICFVMDKKFKELEEDFVIFAKERGCVGIKGHKLVGGFRASTYNALPKESVIALVDAMREFAKLKA